MGFTTFDVKKTVIWRAVVSVLVVAVVTVGLPVNTSSPGLAPAGAQSQSDFANEFVVGGFAHGLSLDWMPDGRAIVGGKWGRLYVVDPANGSQYTYFDLDDIDSTGERGLMDLVVDPNFASNKRFYTYHSDDNSRLTISRYTFTGSANDKATKTVIWANPGPLHSTFGPYHIGGSLNFGPDGRFYLSVGDGFQASNSANLSNVFGKILRINTDGSVPTSNPFYDGGGPNIDEIWAYGLRNPFRTSFDLPTGRYFIGDVGGNDAPTAYEEINLGQAGKNYGWPTCEGPLNGPKSGPTCPAGVTAPISYYSHDPAGACCQNASITGGEVFRSSALPGSLNGAYIYGDFAQREIRYATFNNNGSVAQDRVLKSVPGHQPVWIGAGPDGHIYYMHFSYNGNTSELRRVRYLGGTDSPPVITQASANVTSGTTPLTVSFSGNATDADGDQISYQWDFGDGSTSGSRNASHTYTSAGVYTAQLKVTAGGKTTFSAPIQITAGVAPTVTITSPAHQSTFVAGQSITMSGTATDDGLLDASSYQWDVSLVHDNHVHPAVTGLAGPNRSFTIPTTGHDFAGDTSYLVTLTVTDSSGTQTQKTVEIEPVKRAITVDTDKAAVTNVVIDGVTRTSPFVLDTVQGFKHSLEAETPVCDDVRELGFSSWNIGGPRVRDYTVPTVDQTVRARYAPTGGASCPDLVDPNVGFGGALNGATASSPASFSGTAVLTGIAGDNASIDRVTMRIQNLADDTSWNMGTASWQTAPFWNLIDRPAAGTTFTYFSESFTPPAPGSFKALVSVTDSAGNKRTPAVATWFDVVSGADTLAPTLTLSDRFVGTSPTAPAAVSSPTVLTGSAADNQGVSHVYIRVRDRATGLYWNAQTDQWESAPVSSLAAFPATPSASLEFSWDFAPPETTGSYTAVAVAYDASGNASVGFRTYFNRAADTVAPTLEFDSPFAAATPSSPAQVSSTVQLGGTANDNVAVGRVLVRIENLDSTMFWNFASQSWQPQPYWSLVARPSTPSPSLDWSTTFAPPESTGSYRALVAVSDASANFLRPVGRTYFERSGLPDTVRPQAGWSGALASTTSTSPALLGSPGTLVGFGTDDRALDRIVVKVQNQSTGAYWNETTSSWQSAVRWNVVSSSSGTSDTFSLSVPVASGTLYRADVASWDAAGNRNPPPETTWFRR